MNIAVLGGRGFVGSAVTDALTQHTVMTMDPGRGGPHHVQVDITDTERVEEAVDGFDAVINLVGIAPTHKPKGTTYTAVHVRGARNVVRACRRNGINRLVHMSALGADPDGPTAFLRTKGAGERTVLESGLDVTVFRPSTIFDDGNPFVRAARRFAPTRLFPHFTMRMQPVYRGDVARMFVKAVEGDIEETAFDIGGPKQMTLFQFAKRIYNAEGYRCIPLPVQRVASVGMHLMEFIPFMPFGADQARSLRLDNTVEENDAPAYIDLISVEEWLEADGTPVVE